MFPHFYEEQVALWRANLVQYGGENVRSFLEANAGLALTLAQSGDTAAGAASLAAALSEAERRGPAWGWSSPQSAEEFASVVALTRSSVAPALAAATAHRDLVCPLAGYDGKADITGMIDRINAFR